MSNIAKKPVPKKPDKPDTKLTARRKNRNREQTMAVLDIGDHQETRKFYNATMIMDPQGNIVNPNQDSKTHDAMLEVLIEIRDLLGS